MTSQAHRFSNQPLKKVVAVTLVNGVDGDPATYVYVPKAGEAVLFDVGVINNLSTRQLLKTKVVCVSHTHLDHFIGFDTLMRAVVPHFRSFEVIGPPGIAKNVSAKYQGYLWNLLEPGQIDIKVYEVNGKGECRGFGISSSSEFEPRLLAPPQLTRHLAPQSTDSEGVVEVTTLSDGSVIKAVALDHGTPSIAYVIETPPRFRVLREKLKEQKLEPGPWLRQLQLALAAHHREEKIQCMGRVYQAGELGDMLIQPLPRQVFGYLTDFGFTRANLDRVEKLLQGVETLVCEANYREQEFTKARQRSHLTTKQAALIAALVGAQVFQPFHISNLYLENIGAAYQEAQSFYENFKALTSRELKKEIASELNRTTGLS